MSHSFWTAERVDALKKMIAEGQTAQHAATVLHIGRSAVIGKATRLGLHFGAPADPKAKHAWENRYAIHRAEGHIKRKAKAQPKVIKIKRKTSTPNQFQPKLVDPDQIEGIPKPIGKVEGYPDDPAIAPQTCRYVYGDVQKPGWQWCGHKTIAGKAYCAGHAAKFYDKPLSRPGNSTRRGTLMSRGQMMRVFT